MLGSGPPLDIPVSIFAFRKSTEYWHGGKIKYFWDHGSYNANFYAETWNGQHAACVSDHVLSDCVVWMLARSYLRDNI